MFAKALKLVNAVKCQTPHRERVSERAALEAELLRERRYCELVVNSAPFLVVALALDGTIDFLNTAACRVTEYQAEELIGRNWWRLLYPGEDYAQVEKLLSTLSNFSSRDYEMTLTTKTGKKRLIAWNAVNFLDAEKLPRDIIGIGIDVTDRRRLECELRQAQKMEAIGRFAGGIAHDFNNLATIILGNADLLRGKMEQGVRAGPLQEIVDAARRAARLSQHLSAYCTPSAMDVPAVDANDVITEFSPLLKHLLGDDIELQTHLAADLAPVHMEPCQFEQVLLNLTVNSRDAMPAGGRLTIETRNAALKNTFNAPCRDIPAGEYACVVVSDTGGGMTDAVRERIFEPFFTTKEYSQGAGMGLATVLEAIKQAGGYIGVESKLDRGSTFHIYFPSTLSEGQGKGTETAGLWGNALTSHLQRDAAR